MNLIFFHHLLRKIYGFLVVILHYGHHFVCQLVLARQGAVFFFQGFSVENATNESSETETGSLKLEAEKPKP